MRPQSSCYRWFLPPVSTATSISCRQCLLSPVSLAERATGSDVDSQGRLKRSGGEIVVAFSKHEGTSLKRLREEEPGYFE